MAREYETWAWSWMTMCSNAQRLLQFSHDTVFVFVNDLCSVSLYSVVLIPLAFCSLEHRMCLPCVCCVLRGQHIPTFIWCNIFLHIYAISFLANSMHRIRNYRRVKTPERIPKHSRITSGLSMCETII